MDLAGFFADGGGQNGMHEQGYCGDGAHQKDTCGEEECTPNWLVLEYGPGRKSSSFKNQLSLIRKESDASPVSERSGSGSRKSVASNHSRRFSQAVKRKSTFIEKKKNCSDCSLGEQELNEEEQEERRKNHLEHLVDNLGHQPHNHDHGHKAHNHDHDHGHKNNIADHTKFVNGVNELIFNSLPHNLNQKHLTQEDRRLSLDHGNKKSSLKHIDPRMSSAYSLGGRKSNVSGGSDGNLSFSIAP